MGYAFISYNSHNLAEATAMRELLNRSGVKTWMAPGDIPLGKQYAQVINAALKNCSCLVLMLSKDAQESVFVAKEVERAVSRRKTIIAAQLDQIGLKDEFEYFLSDTQLIAVQKIDETAAEARRIVEAVKALCGDEGKAPDAEADSEKSLPVTEIKPVPAVTPQKRRKKLLPLVTALVLCLGALGVYFALRPSAEISLPGGGALQSATKGLSGFDAENLFDGDTETKWMVSFQGEALVEWQPAAPIRPGLFILTTAADNTQYPGSNPKSAALYARKDENAKWEEIWRLGTPGFWDEDRRDYRYIVHCQEEYACFRLLVTETGGSEYLQLSGLDIQAARD